MQKVRIGVLISGGGSNLQALIDEIDKGHINGEIAVVASDRKDAYGLERAKKHGIENIAIEKKEFSDRIHFFNAINEMLMRCKVNFVVLAGFMTIIPKEFVEQYEGRIINIHPALIPSFCGDGYYGEIVHRAALDYGVKISGATVHFVDEKTDAGPIILQEAVPVMEDDTIETLAARVLKVEHRILPEAVKLYCEGRLRIEGRKVRIV